MQLNTGDQCAYPLLTETPESLSQANFCYAPEPREQNQDQRFITYRLPGTLTSWFPQQPLSGPQATPEQGKGPPSNNAHFGPLRKGVTPQFMNPTRGYSSLQYINSAVWHVFSTPEVRYRAAL